MSLNNLKKTILYYKPESIPDFTDVHCDLFLITSAMVIFNPTIHTISRLELVDGGEVLRYQISSKKRPLISDHIFENIYFIRFRESNTVEESLILNKIKIKKVTISGWHNMTNWLLPF